MTAGAPPTGATKAQPIRPATSLTTQPSKTWKDHWLAIAAAWALVLVVGALYYNQKYDGRLGSSVSSSVGRVAGSVANGGLDGRYTCSTLESPSTLVIDGGTASMDFGFMSARGMRVERHGDTVTLSGGEVYDAEGRHVKLPPDEKAGVELLTVGDDGQSLSLHMRDDKRAKFVKQP